MIVFAQNRKYKISYPIIFQIAFLGILVSIAGCSSLSSDWLTTQKSGTVYSYQKFIKKHPDSLRAKEAKIEIERITWNKIKGKNTAKMYKKYISRYPQGIYISDARSSLEKIVWTSAIKNKSTADYQELITDFSLEKHIPKSRDKLEHLFWLIVTENKTIQAYHSYIQAVEKKTIVGLHKQQAASELKELLGISLVSEKEWTRIAHRLLELIAPYKIQDIHNKTKRQFPGANFELSHESKTRNDSTPKIRVSLRIVAADFVVIAHSLANKKGNFMLGFPEDAKYREVVKLINPKYFSKQKSKLIDLFEEIELAKPNGTSKQRFYSYKNNWYKVQQNKKTTL